MKERFQVRQHGLDHVIVDVEPPVTVVGTFATKGHAQNAATVYNHQVAVAREVTRKYEAVVDVNEMLPWVSVQWLYDDADKSPTSTRSPGEWFVSGDEASQLLDDVPDYLSQEEYILWYLDGGCVFTEGGV